MTSEDLRYLPKQPGVYIMYNAQGEVIYVGKSKALKNRVSSYFTSLDSHLPKVAAMVANIDHFEIIVTDSEFEALVLECSLIKQYQPKYNILLKDDKSHPFIKITFNNPYPHIELARQLDKDGAKYFGPYLSGRDVTEAIGIVKKVWGVRTCSRVLPRDIGKYRPCLNYHIKQCTAPCDNRISQQDYRGLFDEITQFLEGKTTSVIKELRERMFEQSETLNFEAAAKTRDKLLAIEGLNRKQKIISTKRGNQDIIAIANDGKTICIVVFFVRDGKISGKEQFFLEDASLDPAELTADFIKQHYSMATYIPGTILLQYETPDMDMFAKWLSEKTGSTIELICPKRGDRKAVVDMALRNAVEALQLRIAKNNARKQRVDNLLYELKTELNLSAIPYRIESYDISHTGGADSVGVMIVFSDGVPKKSAYRKFNIKTAEAADDYSALREVLFRRFSRAKEGDAGFLPMPDLLLLDGGKGHVTVAKEILDFFELDIPLFGMVKDRKHRTAGLITLSQNFLEGYSDNNVELNNISNFDEVTLNRQGRVFRLIVQIQDEVHRFAITSHKVKHKISAFASELTKIKGIGPKKQKILLQAFKTIDGIKNATVEQLAAVKGIDKASAAAIAAHFSKGEH